MVATPTPTRGAEILVGDIYTFGAYEQDNNIGNGKEGIQWYVKSVTGGKALLTSVKGLDAKTYNDAGGGVTWETCSLRTWLNATFLNNAFSTSEKTRIATTTVSTPNNSSTGMLGGNSTSDKVFLLSYEESELYYDYWGDRIVAATAYAVARGALATGGKCNWWLRTPGAAQSSVVIISEGGVADMAGDSAQRTIYAVCPAVWITIS